MVKQNDLEKDVDDEQLEQCDNVSSEKAKKKRKRKQLKVYIYYICFLHLNNKHAYLFGLAD